MGSPAQIAASAEVDRAAAELDATIANAQLQRDLRLLERTLSEPYISSGGWHHHHH